jgi:ankyrin repeat protein
MELNESFLEACEEGDKEGALEALKKGADLLSSNEFGWNAFYCAVAGEQLELAQWLLTEGVDPMQRNTRGGTSFQMAVQHGDLDFVDQLFDTKTCVNLQDDDGRFPLAEQVSMNDNADLTRYLIQHGADVNLQNKDGWTALMYTVDQEYSWKDIFQVLIAAGADVNHQTKDGWTPLLYASKNPHRNDDIFDLLLDAPNLDVNLTGRHFGWTPLMAAVTADNASVALHRVGQLLERGADVDAKMAFDDGPKHRAQHDVLPRNCYERIAVSDTYQGYTALKWATKLGRSQIESLLR